MGHLLAVRCWNHFVLENKSRTGRKIRDKLKIQVNVTEKKIYTVQKTERGTAGKQHSSLHVRSYWKAKDLS